ncbi:unnamed protein product [Thlaspi arvense]|uniref:Uncharacterized protein n=1 Tax=Thlaspi arvense TaxID=13288 RepID=A0AAU9RJ26_THLAR|nr:unnamed protein product [Thlaspi arvense]
MVTEVHGRTFGVWTLLTCTLCFLCAFNLDNKPLYLATLCLLSMPLMISKLSPLKTMKSYYLHIHNMDVVAVEYASAGYPEVSPLLLCSATKQFWFWNILVFTLKNSFVLPQLVKMAKLARLHFSFNTRMPC